MNLDLEPGDFVINPLNKSWGIGQIQSIIKNKATVNFENKGKLVINIEEIILEKVKILKKKVMIKNNPSKIFSPGQLKLHYSNHCN